MIYNITKYYKVVMFTTSSFQKKPNYYYSLEECEKSYKDYKNTNPRYRYFQQTHFTAGDIEQFEKYRHSKNNIDQQPYVDLSSNVFNDILLDTSWEKYKNIVSNTISDTFNYIFNKFRSTKK